MVLFTKNTIFPSRYVFCRIEHEETFLDLMKQKFLSGQDTSVNYGSIDADTSLDDHFAHLEQQNAEDAYFESSD